MSRSKTIWSEWLKRLCTLMIPFALFLGPGVLSAADANWSAMPSGLSGGTYVGSPLIISSEFGYCFGPVLFKGSVGLGGGKLDLGYAWREQQDSGGPLPYTRGFSASLSLMDTWLLADSGPGHFWGLELRGHYKLFGVKLGYYLATDSNEENIFFAALGLTL